MKNLTLFICCCFCYSSIFAQYETYLIHPAYTNQVITELQDTPKVYKVEQNTLSIDYLENPTLEDEKILVQQRMDKNGSFVLQNETDIRGLNGSFRALGSYWIIDEDYGMFFKGGLINESIMKASDIAIVPRHVDNCNVLIRNMEDGGYFLVQSDFLKMIGTSSSLDSMANGVFKRTKSLEKISSIAYTIEQYQSMIERCKELTASLIVHSRMAKKGTMNKKQLKKWKTDLEEAKKLSEEIALFKSIYETKGFPLTNSLKKETTENYKDFSKVITKASKDLSL